MNKKLVKRVAVASLAALITIPNLTMTTEAKTQITVEMAQEKLDFWKAEKEKEPRDYDIKDIEDSIQDWQETLDDVKAGKVIWSYDNKEEYNKDKAKRDQERANLVAQQAVVQAEKERIANTVYPLTAKYVKDFVPAVDDYQPHFYERPELPGVIFTLQQDSFGKLVDIKPNIKITEMPDYYRETNANGNKELLYTDTCQVIKVSYISPFNFAGKVSLGDFGLHSDLNNAALMAGWCHWIGENMEVQYDKTVNMHYKSGWPESYIGKQVNEITEANAIQPYGWYPTVTFRRKPIEEIKASARVYFSTDERVDSIGTAYKHINEHLGSSWVDTQDIYSVAREHGTD